MTDQEKERFERFEKYVLAVLTGGIASMPGRFDDRILAREAMKTARNMMEVIDREWRDWAPRQ